MAWINEKINDFVTYPTVKRTKERRAICKNKILECVLDDESVKYYWANGYNCDKITHFFGKKIKVKK